MLTWSTLILFGHHRARSKKLGKKKEMLTLKGTSDCVDIILHYGATFALCVVLRGQTVTGTVVFLRMTGKALGKRFHFWYENHRRHFSSRGTLMNEEMRKWERMLRHNPISFEPGGSTLCLVQKTLSSRAARAAQLDMSQRHIVRRITVCVSKQQTQCLSQQQRRKTNERRQRFPLQADGKTFLMQ